jgi:DNA-binding winged helix-turn-helix (wHTH) protein
MRTLPRLPKNYNAVVPAALSFGPFQLDERSMTLHRDGEPLAVPERHARLLFLLANNAGTVISKDALVAAGWGEIAVTDNSVEQVISALRRTLGVRADGGLYIETVPRRGYRFAASVSRVVNRESDAALEALLAPHRAWVEGRAALETLEHKQIAAAETTFAHVLTVAPDYAPAHIGLANAYAFRFEASRVDATPDVKALTDACRHAREGCRLDPESAEGWATLAFVLHRTSDPNEAIAAARRAVSLEPDNWRHYLRLASVSWGEERLRACSRTLHLMPGLALAHWLAATVHVARQSFAAAERELDAGAAAQDEQRAAPARFSGVGLHWLRGLVRLRQGDEDAACAAFERELSFERAGHLYGRECCANTWYALGALRLRAHEPDAAVVAFDEALQRVNNHRLSLVARTAITGQAAQDTADHLRSTGAERSPTTIDQALALAIGHTLHHQHQEAAAIITDMLATAPASATGWIIPVEPLLDVSGHLDVWTHVLAVLRTRAA